MTSSPFGCDRLRARLCCSRALVLLVGLLAQVAQSQAAPKAQQSRELQAREAFAIGRYQEALELFGKLYAEKLHPTYLRNIGRCYQKLKNPDRALDSFRDYLHKAGKITAAERSEIDGYIAEMEDLKRQQAADAERAQAGKPAPAAAAAVPAAQPVVAPPQPQLVTATVPSVPPPTPFYKRGWFWGVAAGVVAVGVVGGLFAAGVFSESSDPCAGRVCLPAAGGP